MKKTQRLDKVLAMSGYGSRKDVKKIIKLGGVTVNGLVATDAGAPVRPEVDDIRVFDKPLEFYAKVYIMMNKPSGVISSTRDGRETTVIDLLEGAHYHRKLFPAGRLDKDAEGLILLTDDGALAHRLLSPKYRVPKGYYIEVEGNLEEADVKAFETGIDLGDFVALPAELTILKSGDTSKALVKVVEGKFHQVKRMVEAVGKKVAYLKRLALGPLELDEELEPGEWRELTDEEIRELKG